MFDTKVMVAPNSPKERAKPNTVPVRIPGIVKGRVIVINTRQGEAPSVLAACSSFISTASIASLMALTINGKETIAAASAAPCQLKLKLSPVNS